jgi:hypothetical protein
VGHVVTRSPAPAPAYFRRCGGRVEIAAKTSTHCDAGRFARIVYIYAKKLGSPAIPAGRSGAASLPKNPKSWSSIAKTPSATKKSVIPLDIIGVVIEPDCIPPARLAKQFFAAEARRR